MGPDLVLNDLSFIQPAATRQEACERMELLIDTLRRAVNAGVSPRLRTDEHFSGASLAPDWSVQHWRADNTLDSDMRAYIQTLEHMAPPFADDPVMQASLNGLTHGFRGYPADLLGVASLLDGLGVSLLSEECWDAPEVTIDQYQGGSVEPKQVKHASRPEHLTVHTTWINQVLRGRVSNGRVLWEQRSTLFPSLCFTEHAGKYIRGRGNDEIFRQVWKRLRELEHWCQKGETSTRDFGKIPGDKSPETSRTLAEYGDKRTWTCPDGQVRTFSYHLKLTADKWRVYIHEHPTTGKVFVGHVGRHLPIATEHT